MSRIAVGIDVARGKSVAAAVDQSMELLLAPFPVSHTVRELNALADTLRRLGGDLRVVMEATGHYSEPVARHLHAAGFFVSVVNPYLVKDFGNNTLRKVKTDKADAVRIARYGIHYWAELRRYAPADGTRARLKELNRQFLFYTDRKIAQQGHLVYLLDRAFPAAHKLFINTPKADGRLKWVDFVTKFWHCDIVNQMTEDEFAETYRAWCRENNYEFKPRKAADIYVKSFGLIPTLSKDAHTEALIALAARQLTAISRDVESLRARMCDLAQELPEYPAVTGLFGTGKSIAAQLMAEIGDVRDFKRIKSLPAFAGVDPGRKQSGDTSVRSVAVTKNGSAHLRRTLSFAMDVYVLEKPAGEPVYEFYKKKRAEGKHYFVCKVAAANKFLRIYYARVKEYLDGMEC
jgi:transposase